MSEHGKPKANRENSSITLLLLLTASLHPPPSPVNDAVASTMDL